MIEIIIIKEGEEDNVVIEEVMAVEKSTKKIDKDIKYIKQITKVKNKNIKL